MSEQREHSQEGQQKGEQQDEGQQSQSSHQQGEGEEGGGEQSPLKNYQQRPAMEHSNSEVRRIAAAQVIQSNYRGYKTRSDLKGNGHDADSRWGETLKSAKLDRARKQQFPGDDKTEDAGAQQTGAGGAEDGQEAKEGGGGSMATSRWKRGGLFVGQIAGSPSASKGKDGEDGSGGFSDGPVEGGPSFPDGPEGGDDDDDGEDDDEDEGEDSSARGKTEKHSSDDKIGDVPGGNENGKIDNVKSIAKPHQRTLRMIEKWTKGAPAVEIGKTMESIYWLEMVDRKHRYGSNLKHYHAEWLDSDTKENFFYWLDEGEGKDMDLDDTPRERLEKERIEYLSADQRRNYVVDIKDGRLFWRHNGKPLDTTKGKWKDLGEGRGIVEVGPEEQEKNRQHRAEQRRQAGGSGSAASSSSSVSDPNSNSSMSSSGDDDSEDSSVEAEEATHYGADQSKTKKHFGMLNSKNWTNALLRKTLKANIWIYVLNSRRELYVGIKQTGKFQHSSFLYGGRVISAGLLKCRDGVLQSLSPLSGHYRAGTVHFRCFVNLLQQEGVDLSHVKLSKSLLLLKVMEKHKERKSKKSQKKKEKAKEKEKEKEKSKTKDEGGLPLLRKLRSGGDNGEDESKEDQGEKEASREESSKQDASKENDQSNDTTTTSAHPETTDGKPNNSTSTTKKNDDDDAKTLSEKLQSTSLNLGSTSTAATEHNTANATAPSSANATSAAAA